MLLTVIPSMLPKKPLYLSVNVANNAMVQVANNTIVNVVVKTVVNDVETRAVYSVTGSVADSATVNDAKKTG